jgi:DMATS type aromatic prenyltransferase
MATYQDIARTQLHGLTQALGLSRDAERHEEVRARLFEGWGDAEVPQKPGYLSAIGDDHSPFEYSVALGPDASELRLLFEAQGREPGLAANRSAALSFNERLAPYGASLARFDRIRDLFLPENPQGPFTLWHAVTFGSAQPDFKVYLNPFARGPAHAWGIITEALTRLGMGNAVKALKAAANRGGVLDQPNYFSLDLSRAPSARVKVYLRHPDATAAELERTFSHAPRHRSGDVIEFCRSMIGHVGPFTSKPATSCFSFVEGSDQPLAATLHLPVAHYLDNDASVRRRVMAYLESHHLSADHYDRALAAMANRPLDQTRGVQSYASYRREGTGIRVTAYLSPELFRQPAAVVSHARLRSVSAVTTAAERPPARVASRR